MVGAPAEEPGPRRSGPSGGGRGARSRSGLERTDVGNQRLHAVAQATGHLAQRTPARSSRRYTSSPSRFRWPAGRGVGLRWRLSLSPRTGRRPGRPWLAAVGSCPGDLRWCLCTPLGAGPPLGGGLLPRLCALLGGGTSLGTTVDTRSNLVCRGREIVSRLPSTLFPLRARPTPLPSSFPIVVASFSRTPRSRSASVRSRFVAMGGPTHFQVSEL